jgi:putative addiction module killer protein
MWEIQTTLVFDQWFNRLRDAQGKLRITARLRRIEQTGNLGEFKSLGRGLSEIRFDFGPGYRIYFVMRGQTLLVLLGGGDKSTQSKDIEQALAQIE